MKVSRRTSPAIPCSLDSRWLIEVFIFLSAFLAWLAFPPADVGMAAWGALCPLLLTWKGIGFREGFKHGWLWGFAFFGSTCFWLKETLVNYGYLALPVALSVLALLVGYLAVYPALVGGVAAVLHDKKGLPFALMVPPLWVASDFLREYALTGFPWSVLGYTQHQWPGLLQASALTGVYGTTFLLVLANAILADVADNPRAFRRWLPSGMVWLVLMGGSLFYGKGILEVPFISSKTLPVVVAQGNIPQEMKWEDSAVDFTIERYLALTRAGAARGAKLVVWPEASTPFLYRYQFQYRSYIEEALREFGLHLLFGTPDRVDGKLYNSALLAAPNGSIPAAYHKRHLVPFGEYVPLPSLLWFVKKMAYGPSDWDRGREFTVFPYPGVPLSTVICYEVAFPNEVRAFVNAGAHVLVTVTNEAWFGESAASAQIMAMTAFRAAENRRPLIRAANTGISAIFDQYGEVLSSLPLKATGFLYAEVPLPEREPVVTPFTLYGPILAWLCLGVSMGLSVLGVALAWKLR